MNATLVFFTPFTPHTFYTTIRANGFDCLFPSNLSPHGFQISVIFFKKMNVQISSLQYNNNKNPPFQVSNSKSLLMQVNRLQVGNVILNGHI